MKSMTAFARYDLSSDWGEASWELRSVNQRYLETTIRLPETLRSIEPMVREKLRSQFIRGKIECQLRLNFKPETQAEAVTFNQALAKQLLSAAETLKNESQHGTIELTEILKWPGVIDSRDLDLDQITVHVLTALDHAIDRFITARLTEGAALKQLLTQRLEAMTKELETIRQQIPNVIAQQKAKLIERFHALDLSSDLPSAEKEIVLLVQKLDISEEIDRLTTHINETYKILDKSEAVGRRLDFMMQEFNRETNTIASKSVNSGITNATIELKVLIEQMREQIQNIE